MMLRLKESLTALIAKLIISTITSIETFEKKKCKNRDDPFFGGHL